MGTGLEIPLLTAMLGPEALGAAAAGTAAAGTAAPFAAVPAGFAGLGATAPMTGSLLGPAAATPMFANTAATAASLPMSAGVIPGGSAGLFGSGMSAVPEAASLSLGAPPAASKAFPWAKLGSAANSALQATGGQQSAPPPAPLPNKQQDSGQMTDAFTKYMGGGGLMGLDPKSRELLMMMGGMR